MCPQGSPVDAFPARKASVVIVAGLLSPATPLGYFRRVPVIAIAPNAPA
jgi:hypothetical protein